MDIVAIHLLKEQIPNCLKEMSASEMRLAAMRDDLFRMECRLHEYQKTLKVILQAIEK